MLLTQTRFQSALFAAALVLSASSFAATDKTLNVLNMALEGEPPVLNTMKTTDAESFFVIGHVFEGLTRIGENAKVMPGVAESWKLTDKEATFKLRKNAKWSDGKPVTANDFVTAWRAVVDPKTAAEYASIINMVANADDIVAGKKPPTELGVKALDDHTFQVTFSKPCGYFLGLTAFGVLSPVRADVLAAKGERYGADAGDMVYNGPFMLTKWVHGASLTMDKNPNYWNAASIALDRIDIPVITPDNSARFNFYKDGKVDVLKRLNKDDLPKAQAAGLKLKNFTEGTLFFLEYNFRPGKPTANKNLRKAIQLVFNQNEYLQKIVGIPGTKPGVSLIPSFMPGVKGNFLKEYPVAQVKMNEAEAKRLIELARKELGGTIPPLVYVTGDTPFAASEAEYFQGIMKSKLGLELRIDKQIFKQRLAKMRAGEFDIVAAGWGPDYMDPMTYADLFTSWNENNHGKYSNPRYDELIKTAQSTSDQKKRMDAMAEVNRIAMEDLIVMPTYERGVMYLANDKFQGIIRNQVGPDPDFTRVRVVKK